MCPFLTWNVQYIVVVDVYTFTWIQNVEVDINTSKPMRFSQSFIKTGIMDETHNKTNLSTPEKLKKSMNVGIRLCTVEI